MMNDDWGSGEDAEPREAEADADIEREWQVRKQAFWKVSYFVTNIANSFTP